jgi:hypothetical protein
MLNSDSGWTNDTLYSSQMLSYDLESSTLVDVAACLYAACLLGSWHLPSSCPLWLSQPTPSANPALLTQSLPLERCQDLRPSVSSGFCKRPLQLSHPLAFAKQCSKPKLQPPLQAQNRAQCASSLRISTIVLVPARISPRIAASSSSLTHSKSD